MQNQRTVHQKRTMLLPNMPSMILAMKKVCGSVCVSVRECQKTRRENGWQQWKKSRQTHEHTKGSLQINVVVRKLNNHEKCQLQRNNETSLNKINKETSVEDKDKMNKQGNVTQ